MKKIIVAFTVALSFLIPSYAHADDTIPVLVSISPTSGDIDGGNVVTLNGADFTESTVIRVGGIVVSDTFVSSTQITIVMPARSAGFVSIGAFSGMVGAVLTNAYEYIDIPDPTPTPEPDPTPTPEPTPTPTPEPTPTPTPEASPAPSPVLVSDPGAAPVSNFPNNSSDGQIPNSLAEQDSAQISVQNEVVLSQPLEQNIFPIYRYSNGVTVFTNETQMNVFVNNLFTKRFRFTLQKRINGTWKTLSIAYRKNNGELTFYGIPLSEGRYRIVNAAKPIKWFSI